jgi:hypothetical protein
MINPAIIDAENHGSVNSYFKLYQMKNYFVRTNLTLRKVTNIYISIAFIINLTLFFFTASRIHNNSVHCYWGLLAIIQLHSVWYLSLY